KPIFYMEHFINPIIPTDIFTKDETFTSIQQIVSERANVELTVADESIEAVNADPFIAEYLEIPQFTALLKGKRISYTSKNNPINIDVFYTNTSKWKYFSSYRY